MTMVLLEQHIYVAIGHEGLIKVGRTSSIEQRTSMLRVDFKKRGDVMKMINFLPSMINARWAETYLIHRMKSEFVVMFGNEWFSGTDYESAFRMAIESRLKFLTPIEKIEEAFPVPAFSRSDIYYKLCQRGAELYKFCKKHGLNYRRILALRSGDRPKRQEVEKLGQIFKENPNFWQ